MKDLNEHNKGVFPANTMRENNGAGVKCPVCAEELLVTHPGQTNCSNPPSTLVHCDGCGYSGLKY